MIVGRWSGWRGWRIIVIDHIQRSDRLDLHVYQHQVSRLEQLGRIRLVGILRPAQEGVVFRHRRQEGGDFHIGFSLIRSAGIGGGHGNGQAVGIVLETEAIRGQITGIEDNILVFRSGLNDANGARHTTGARVYQLALAGDPLLIYAPIAEVVIRSTGGRILRNLKGKLSVEAVYLCPLRHLAKYLAGETVAVVVKGEGIAIAPHRVNRLDIVRPCQRDGIRQSGNRIVRIIKYRIRAQAQLIAITIIGHSRIRFIRPSKENTPLIRRLLMSDVKGVLRRSGLFRDFTGIFRRCRRADAAIGIVDQNIFVILLPLGIKSHGDASLPDRDRLLQRASLAVKLTRAILIGSPANKGIALPHRDFLADSKGIGVLTVV